MVSLQATYWSQHNCNDGEMLLTTNWSGKWQNKSQLEGNWCYPAVWCWGTAENHTGHESLSSLHSYKQMFTSAESSYKQYPHFWYMCFRKFSGQSGCCEAVKANCRSLLEDNLDIAFEMDLVFFDSIPMDLLFQWVAFRAIFLSCFVGFAMHYVTLSDLICWWIAYSQSQ